MQQKKKVLIFYTFTMLSDSLIRYCAVVSTLFSQAINSVLELFDVIYTNIVYDSWHCIHFELMSRREIEEVFLEILLSWEIRHSLSSIVSLSTTLHSN